MTIAIAAVGIAGHGVVSRRGAVVLAGIVLAVISAAGGQSKHQQQRSQQESQTSFHICASFARALDARYPNPIVPGGMQKTPENISLKKRLHFWKNNDIK